MGGCTAAFNQKAFRGRNDDGNETTATWQANQNVAWLQNVDVNFRVRLEVQETAGCAKTNFTTIQLQYNLAGAGWVNVTATSNVVRSSASPNLADGANTTDQLTVGTGTFVGGGGFDEVNGIAGNTNMDISASGHFEVEYCCQLRSADVVAGQVVELRVTDGGTGFAAYDATASLSVNETMFMDVFDEVHLTEDTPVFLPMLVPAAGDDVTVADDGVTVLLTNLVPSASDDVATTEDVTVVLITAEAALSVSVFDDVTIAEDSPVQVSVYIAEIVDTVTVTEDTVADMVLPASAASDVTVADESTVLMSWYLADPADSVTVSEDVSVSIPLLSVDVFDDVAIAEDVAMSLGGAAVPLSIDVFDAVTITEDIESRHRDKHRGILMFQWEGIEA